MSTGNGQTYLPMRMCDVWVRFYRWHYKCRTNRRRVDYILISLLLSVYFLYFEFRCAANERNYCWRQHNAHQRISFRFFFLIKFSEERKSALRIAYAPKKFTLEIGFTELSRATGREKKNQNENWINFKYLYIISFYGSVPFLFILVVRRAFTQIKARPKCVNGRRRRNWILSETVEFVENETHFICLSWRWLPQLIQSNENYSFYILYIYIDAAAIEPNTQCPPNMKQTRICKYCLIGG